MRARTIATALVLASALAVLVVGSAGATATSTGTWTLYPAQTYTETTTTTTGTAYKTAVRPPINADGTSNFSGKRGVIPVQFDLLGAPTTTTTVTRTYAPPVFESIFSDASTDNDVSFLSLTPNGTLHFGDLTTLTAGYTFAIGDCHGGSLRWQVRIDANDSGVRDPSDPAVFLYYGAYPQFGNTGVNGCTPASVAGEDSSGHNMLAADRTDDLRFDTSQFAGGTFYDSYTNALALAGTHQVLSVSLVLDSGWQGPPEGSGDQKLTLGTVTVNENTFVQKTTETSSSTVAGAYAKTCNLPAAELRWSKDDPLPDGAINEAESVQPKDTGQYYRQVDCKYIYNLDVSSLQGQGTYRVYARIAGTNVDAPAKFDLK